MISKMSLSFIWHELFLAELFVFIFIYFLVCLDRLYIHKEIDTSKAVQIYNLKQLGEVIYIYIYMCVCVCVCVCVHDLFLFNSECEYNVNFHVTT